MIHTVESALLRKRHINYYGKIYIYHTMYIYVCVCVCVCACVCVCVWCQ
jgi:hypothetical protein